MYLRFESLKTLIFIVALGTTSNWLAAKTSWAQDDDLRKLGGTWLFVEDRTEGRAVDAGGPPMSVKFSLRVEKDAVIYPRTRGDERITLDGSVIERKNNNGSITRYSGVWKDGALEYTLETIRLSDNKSVSVIKREFRATPDGLMVTRRSDGSVALYRHPEEIALPEPVKATISNLDWLSGVWIGTRRTSEIEERWSPSKGGALLGVSRTVRNDRMVSFEYLRIVERDGGLVYVAQPGGRSPTEFVLTSISNNRAVFVNPRHDYPQRIVYEMSKEGGLTASIGFAKGRLQDFSFSREKK